MCQQTALNGRTGGGQQINNAKTSDKLKGHWEIFPELPLVFLGI